MDWLSGIKGWTGAITSLGIAAVALTVVLQVLFGGTVPFLGIDVVGNIIALISSLGSEGLVGLIALAILYWAFTTTDDPL